MISQSLITSAYSTKAKSPKVWLNLHSLFYGNKESIATKLETKLRSISIGGLSVHAYYHKTKKIVDLLEGHGENFKERNMVIHVINDISSKFDGVAGIIRYEWFLYPYRRRHLTQLLAPVPKTSNAPNHICSRPKTSAAQQPAHSSS